MMDREQEILQNIEALAEKNYISAQEKGKLLGLKYYMENSPFTFVVLGEFSRGKSTVINAFLGEELLPMDVLPETALIHTIRYGRSPKLTVVNLDGTKEIGTAEREYLEQFGARKQKADNISHIQLELPASFLADNFMLVDTPGVSDMNEQRAEITYGFLPQADVVIMVIDATAPFKRTERDFILQRVLPQGIKRIVFVANKLDNLDE